MKIKCYALNLLCVVFVFGAMLADLKTDKISNRLIVSGIITGGIVQIGMYGVTEFYKVLAGLFLPVIILFLMYILRVIGAGDVKLFSMIGVYLQIKDLLLCMVLSFLVAAMLSLVKLFTSKRGLELLNRGFRYLLGKSLGSGQVYVWEAGRNGNLIHFSIAILMGIILTLML